MGNVKWHQGKPPERESMFSKFKGTDKWRNAMFEHTSDKVLVTVEYNNSSRYVAIARTVDGRWNVEWYGDRKVIAWAPMPEPYEGGLNDEQMD